MNFLTAPQFAKEIGITRGTLASWERKNLIKPHHISLTGRRFYSQEQIEAYFNGSLITEKRVNEECN